jgi:hypothetical protein
LFKPNHRRAALLGQGKSEQQLNNVLGRVATRLREGISRTWEAKVERTFQFMFERYSGDAVGSSI